MSPILDSPVFMQTTVRSMSELWLPDGPRRVGWALDWHTEPGGKSSPIGERLYQLKYKSDISQLAPLIEALADFLATRVVRPWLAATVPILPSKEDRPWQPVRELAKGLAERTGIPLAEGYLVKRQSTPMLKSIESSAERERVLAGVFIVTDPERYRGQLVLLFDDIFETGTTLAEAARVLLEQGGVDRVYALVVTRTRTRPA